MPDDPAVGKEDEDEKKKRRRAKRPGGKRTSKMKRDSKRKAKGGGEEEKTDKKETLDGVEKFRQAKAAEIEDAELERKSKEGSSVKKKKRKHRQDKEEKEKLVETVQEDGSPVKKKKSEKQQVPAEDAKVEEEHRIFVSGLPTTTEEKALLEDFGECGKVRSVKRILNTRGIFKGSAFVTFKKEAGAAKAIETLDGTEYGDKVIAVKKAEPPVKAPNLTVYVGKLPFDADEETLRKDFGDCGEIGKFLMLMDRGAFESKFRGAFLATYKDQAGVDAALKFNSTEYGGRQIVVRLANAKGEGSRKSEESADGDINFKGKGKSKGKGDKGKGKGGKDGKGRGK